MGWGQQEKSRRVAGGRERRVRVALLDVQYGETPDGAKPFGEGLPHETRKIVEDYDGDTYRAVYTAAFPEVVYVLDAFVKKSKSGIKTPQADKDRVRANGGLPSHQPPGASATLSPPIDIWTARATSSSTGPRRGACPASR